MKNEVSKVLEMIKAGTITEEQGAKLIDEIYLHNQQKNEKKGFNARSSSWDFPSQIGEQLVGPIAEAVGNAIPNWISSNKVVGLSPEDLAANSIAMSKVKAPKGINSVFKDNSIKMSHIDDLNLENAEMVGNMISMSKISDHFLKNAKWNGTHISASSLEEIKVDHSDISGLRITASKVDDVLMTDESIIQDLKIDSSHVKRLSVQNGEIHGSQIQAAHASDCKIEKSTLSGVFFKMNKMSEVSFLQSHLSEVVIAGEKDKFWKHSGMSDVQFENVKLKKTVISGCRWKRVKIKNVDLENQNIRYKDLCDITIDGNEEFLRVLGETGEEIFRKAPEESEEKSGGKSAS